ncbi:hypothetical protein CapIbe_009708 [Capra ibex]
MSPAAGLGQRRKLRPSRWATPCPQTRGMNGPPAPRRRREHQSPAGSGAARTEGKEGGEARERVSARERPGKRRRNWARRAAASPRASCGSGSSEGGGAAAPPAALRARKVACQRGQAARKEGDESSGPSSDLEAPGSPATASTYARRRAEATHRPPPRLRGPQRARVSSSDPTPQPRFGSATREHSAVPLCQGCPHHVPAPPQGQWRGSSLSALPPPAQPTSTEKPEEGPKGFRAPYRDRRVEVRSSRGTAAVWGSPSSSRVANLKLCLREPPARAAECCSSRRFGEAGGRETASYPSPCLQPCDCPSLSTPQPEHPSEALHLIFITFHSPGKKTIISTVEEGPKKCKKQVLLLWKPNLQTTEKSGIPSLMKSVNPGAEQLTESQKRTQIVDQKPGTAVFL